MTAKQVSYTFDSTLETINNAEAQAGRIATEAGFSDDDVMSISMAVREAAVNAVLHGNAYDPTKKVTLAFEQDGKDLTIVVRDQGKGVNLDAIPDCCAPENLLKQSGRGLFLMRSLMDDVQINASPTGTEVKLIKHFPGTAGNFQEASH